MRQRYVRIALLREHTYVIALPATIIGRVYGVNEKMVNKVDRKKS